MSAATLRATETDNEPDRDVRRRERDEERRRRLAWIAAAEWHERPKLLRLEEAAAIRRSTERTVRADIARGYYRAVKPNGNGRAGHVLVDRDSFRAFIEGDL